MTFVCFDATVTHLTFAAWRDGGRYVPLSEVIRHLGPALATASWRIDAEEVNGFVPPSAEEWLSADELLRHIGAGQIIDGDVAGHLDRDAPPHVVVTAFDSSSWDVRTEDESVVDAVLAAYPDTVEIAEVTP